MCRTIHSTSKPHAAHINVHFVEVQFSCEGKERSENLCEYLLAQVQKNSFTMSNPPVGGAYVRMSYSEMLKNRPIFIKLGMIFILGPQLHFVQPRKLALIGKALDVHLRVPKLSGIRCI